MNNGVEGFTEAEEKKLKPEEMQKDIHLSCQVVPNNGVEIEIPEELLRIKRYRGRLVEKKGLTHDVVRLRIELIEPDKMKFIPGRYIQLECPAQKGEAVTRAYSIASLPGLMSKEKDKELIELMVKRVPAGICTTWIFDRLKEGDTIHLSGPFGEFGLTDTNAPIIFIAGGSGMAPIWSIIQYMKQKKIKRKEEERYPSPLRGEVSAKGGSAFGGR